MIEDVFEPLALFRDRLRQEHAERVAAYFEELVERAGVDENANKQTIEEINRLAREMERKGARVSRRKILRGLVWAGFGAAAAVVTFFLYPLIVEGVHPSPESAAGLLAVAGVAAGLYWLIQRKLTPRIEALKQTLEELEQARQTQLAAAWAQMAPLNALFDPSVSPRLMAETVPRLEFDPWFSNGRLSELQEVFGLDPQFNEEQSILFSQSGVMNGNPFVIGERLRVQMMSHVYRGELDISWQATETYRDANGRLRTRTVTRRQTLHACVTQPKPSFSQDWFVIYGNEAAPNLRFSRVPVGLSSFDSERMKQREKRKKLKKLEAFSRNLDDEYGYTLMANREFEVLFHAVDRSDEVEFRLLFTPLAQKQMVDLLRDEQVGYGDNFSFRKINRINLVRPQHLRSEEVDATPAIFQHYDLSVARQRFNEFQNNYFKAMFFALAPLLTIPIYQQHRSHEDIYRDVLLRTPSNWTHETLANAHGDQSFAHPDSITRNLLKTQSVVRDDHTQEVAVSAHGFRGIQRVTQIRKFGRDGRVHPVPVKWVEYVPVSRSSRMVVREAADLDHATYARQTEGNAEWQRFFQQWQISPQTATLHQFLVSFIARQSGRG